ncbi:MAG TPA: DUF6424 family protein [Acidimicrobiales bacterium]|jgi:hypothetical protein
MSGGTETPSLHQEQEDYPWTINIPDHPPRSDSPAFVASKTLAHKIALSAGVPQLLGQGKIQEHHGGSLYLYDDSGWFLVKNVAGIEWSAQFCADPDKVDQLRQNARRLYVAFPQSAAKMAELGYQNAQQLLDNPIKDANGVAAWVDSIFNSCVPLPQLRHVGVLSSSQTGSGGVHHYPTPITDIELVKHDDFILWVTDPESGQPAAVVPAGRRGSGNGEARVVYATPGTPLAKQLDRAQGKRQTLIAPATHPLAQQAFGLQNSKAGRDDAGSVKKKGRKGPAKIRKSTKSAG